MPTERKARNKLIKTVDIMQPITIDMLGSKDDPCFGKKFDGKNSTCKRCGDSELCLIKMGLTTAVKRKQIEEGKVEIKDKTDVESIVDKAKIHKFLLQKLKKTNPLPIAKAITLIRKQFYNPDTDKKAIISDISHIAKQSVEVKLIKKEGKRYLKQR